MSPLFAGLFERLVARRPRGFEPEVVLATGGSEPDNGRRAERIPCNERALLEWIDEDDDRHAEIVWVFDRSDGGLGVSSPHRLEAGWPVLVTLSEEAPVKAMVRHCEESGPDWIAGLKIVHKERRRHDRSVSRGVAKVVWDSGSHSRREVRVRILDISEGGLGLSGEAAISEQTPVCIIHEGWQRFGTVTHGRAEGERYVFGVQFAGPPRPTQGTSLRD